MIPNSIAHEASVALSYFPELENVPIEFKFKKDIKKSTMQAQPSIGSFFKSRENRGYKIFISKKFKISDEEFLTEDVPSDILIGWLGHELGHIIDYQNKSNFEMIRFGVKYVFSDDHIIAAERAADTYAVMHGMQEYILKTKNFIINHANIEPEYKERIAKYYLSPEEIMELIDEQESADVN